MHIKKVAQIITLLLILVFGFSSIVYANSAVILVDELNVREGPGENYETVDRVHSDEQYPVVQQQDDWIKIQLKNETGWVSEDYTSVKEEADPTVTTITIQADNTQIRSGPSVDDEILAFAREGTHFDVISEVDEWYEIENEGQTGYIHQNLITDDESYEYGILDDKVFVIDAGHGGHDVGAISINDNYEKDITFKTAMELENALTHLGAKVHLTRPTDEFIRLGSRVSSSNYLSPDAFISIHYNSFVESPSVSGIGTYYYHEEDEKLSNNVQKQIIQMTDANDRGAIHEDYLVLRHNKNPALLLELGFISNADEAQLLLTNTYQKKLVQGIVNGLLHYYIEK